MGGPDGRSTNVTAVVVVRPFLSTAATSTIRSPRCPTVEKEKEKDPSFDTGSAPPRFAPSADHETEPTSASGSATSSGPFTCPATLTVDPYVVWPWGTMMSMPGPLPLSARDTDAVVVVPSFQLACTTRVSPARSPAVGTVAWKEPSAARGRLPDPVGARDAPGKGLHLGLEDGSLRARKPPGKEHHGVIHAAIDR